MFVRVHGNKDYVKGNSQSCLDLVQYLNKENDGKDLLAREFFFNQNAENITDNKVVQILDNNHKGLKKNDAKFFMISINPSQYELKHLAQIATGRNVSEISQMTNQELEKYNKLFKEYVNEAMNSYAKCFNRNVTREDLHYFAKVEQQRTYKGHDMEVQNSTVKSGDLKPGLQTHAHVIISRMDREQKMSLSPLANSRGHSEKHQLNGNNIKVGFDRSQFKKDCENQFDRQFSYDRTYNQKYDYYNLKGYDKALGALKNHITYKYVLQGLRPEPTELEMTATKILKTYKLLSKVPSINTFIMEGLKLIGKAASIGMEI